MEQHQKGGGEHISFDDYALSADGLAHLATFPEQNPNAVIETDMTGTILYLNPEAVERFPELPAAGIDHPLLAGVLETVAEFRKKGQEFAQREVEFDAAVFEQKVCYSAISGSELIRIYIHDVTDHRRAEKALAELARRVVDAQEQERKRVSRELHDEAGQAMAALKISLQLLRDEPELDLEAIRYNLDQAIELVDTTRERIRLLAHDLRPPALDTLGLNDTLDDFCSQFAMRTRLRIAYRGEEMDDLDDAQEIALYRLLQEALANVAVHADASFADVRLRRDVALVELSVSDDGRGMDPAVMEDPDRVGIGLVGMRERLEMLGGHLDIEGGPNGTTLSATLPVRLR